ncbi:MAG: ABC transporter substrate-binding protein [Rhodocyclaceae bacterium]|nr:ABC transporter substrate-binding protein [Rhodocyclaceae bacterium]
MVRCTIRAALLLSWALLVTVADAGVPGVTRDSVRIATIQDLSGPIAILGAPIRDGIVMRLDEENARGGVHGRRLTIAVEDSGYDPKKAVLAARRLLAGDDVFAFVGNLGTPVVMATMPLIVGAGRPHLFPFSPHQTTYQPLHPLKFQIFAPYRDYMDAAVRQMVRANGYQRVCLLYQDDDYGLEVGRGVESGLDRLDMALVERTGYKRGATDFSSQIARLQAARCDLVVLATVVRETVAAMREARKVGWPVDMLVTASGYSAQTHELGGDAVEGLYGVSVLPHPYPGKDTSRRLGEWIESYRTRYDTDPNVWSAMGYQVADIFVQALRAAGPGLDVAGFVAAMEGLETTRDFLGGPGYRFSPDDHLGNRRGRLARIVDGRWRLITDYLD